MIYLHVTITALLSLLSLFTIVTITTVPAFQKDNFVRFYVTGSRLCGIFSHLVLHYFHEWAISIGALVIVTTDCQCILTIVSQSWLFSCPRIRRFRGINLQQSKQNINDIIFSSACGACTAYGH